MIWQGAIGTGVVLFIHLALRPLVRKIETYSKGTGDVETLYRMRVICPSDEAALIRTVFMRHVNSQPCMTVHGISIQETDQANKMAVVVDVFSSERKFHAVARIQLEERSDPVHRAGSGRFDDAEAS